MLEAVGFPVAVNPETRLAALARKRGWLVEHWSKAPGAPRPLLPDRPAARDRRQDASPSPAAARPAREGSAVKALRFERKLARYAAARVAGDGAAGRGARVGPLRLVDVDPPELPGPGWVRIRPRLAGICGSDLATVDGTVVALLRPIVSFPFVPGHEVVADADDDTPRRARARARLRRPRHRARSARRAPAATSATASASPSAHLEPGLQTGFCCDTGGGWSTLDGRPRASSTPCPTT